MLRFGFEKVGLEKIVGVTNPQNVASQKVLLKLGLEQDEEVKLFYNVEAAYFSIFREDYKSDAAKYDLSYTEIDD